jgi:hypothetical protein
VSKFGVNGDETSDSDTRRGDGIMSERVGVCEKSLVLVDLCTNRGELRFYNSHSNDSVVRYIKYIFMGLAKPELKNDCTGEGQRQITERERWFCCFWSARKPTSIDF